MTLLISQMDDLTKLAGETESELSTFAEEVQKKAEENRKLLLELDEEMKTTALKANEELIAAAKDISKHGMRNESRSGDFFWSQTDFLTKRTWVRKRGSAAEGL